MKKYNKHPTLKREPSSKINVPARASLFFTASNILSKACALIFTPIFTRLLSREEYGTYSLFSSYLSVLLVLGSLEISGSVIMRAFQKYRELKNLTALVASGISAISSSLVFLAFLLIKRIRAGAELFPYSDVMLAVIMLSTAIINIFVSKTKFLYKWGVALSVSVIQSLLIPILGIGLININPFTYADHVGLKLAAASAVSAGTALVFILVTVSASKRELRASSLSGRALLLKIREIAASVLRLAVPLLPYYLSVMVISQADRIFISEYFNKEAVAVYSVSYSLGISLNAICSGLTGALCPWIMRKVRGGEFSAIQKTLNTLITICSLTVICFLCAAENLLSIIAPPEYSAGLPVTFLISLCPPLLSLSQIMSSVAIAKERTFGVLLSGLIPAVLSVFLNAFALPHIGIYFSAATTSICYLLVAAIGIINTKRICTAPLVNIPKALTKLLLLILTGTLIYLLRDAFFPRLAVGLISAGILLFTLWRSLPLLKEARTK
ncbi:MAG: oligosaccharide flippase family protein [Clostridia bacterium]|nr:oligosaccharide flippase family protein [Clostridia bacterium]